VAESTISRGAPEPDRMAKIHVLTRKEELDGERLPGKVVIVLDVLFATSSIAAALAHGASEVVPTLDGEAALAEARLRPPGSYVLSGELDATTLPGFAHPTPLALVGQDLRGKALIYSTTNGTVALGKARDAAACYAAALVNGDAVVEHVLATRREETILLVCAGSVNRFNLEDFYGAGYLVSLLARRGEHELSDAALAARLLHEDRDALECLRQSRVGRLMRSRALDDELRFAARKGSLAVVPKLEGGRLRAV
jgi:2-phosphosulfolactate phosphatase